MTIGGLQKLSLIDYPGKLACTVFLTGCSFRCPWCYSSELVLLEEIKKQPKISEKEFFDFLEERKDLLEGCVLCGGEPTINKDLPKFIRRIKKLDYMIKLDTNGSNPKMLKDLIKEKLIDYVAMDVKAPREKYKKIVGRRVDIKKIEKSVSLLLSLTGEADEEENKIGYEFRTTIVPGLLKKEDILKIAHWISGADRYYLQDFRSEKTCDPKFEKVKPYPKKYLLEIQKAISPFFGTCQLRE